MIADRCAAWCLARRIIARFRVLLLAVAAVACVHETSAPLLVAGVTIDIGATSLEVGATTQATVGLRDANGHAIARRAVAWSTSDATLATVSANGVVSGIARGGPVTISATVESQRASASLLIGCRTPGELTVGDFAVLPMATTDGCTVRITHAGDYMVVAFVPESGSPTTTLPALPHIELRLDLVGGAAGPGANAANGARVAARAPSPSPDVAAAESIDRERLLLRRREAAHAAGTTCSLLTTGAAIPILTQRYEANAGAFAGHYRDLFQGSVETWQVALTSERTVIVVDSVYWQSLLSHPTERQPLERLASVVEQEVLPTMTRYGMAPRDVDGDGRVAILVPRVPFPRNAYATVVDLGALCPGVSTEAVVIPSSRFESAPEFAHVASMADGASTAMHELTHLYQGFPATTAWYTLEGMARLAEHVWRVGGDGSPFSGRRSALPRGVADGEMELTNSPLTASKHCVDPSLEGLDYLRVQGTIRAYDRGCWALARLASALERRGTPRQAIIPTLVALHEQSRMVSMWNEVTGEERSATDFTARWLAGAVLDESRVAARDTTLRDPVWNLADVVAGSAFDQSSRLRGAVFMDATTRVATLAIIDESAQMVRLAVGAGASLRIGTPDGAPLGATSAVRLLLVRLR